jgi:hypothetical protein
MKTITGVLLVVLVQGLVGCGGSSSPSAPTATSPPSAPSPPPAPSPVPLPGTFHISFSADAACTELPAVARTRTYSATTRGGLIDLGGATFGGDGSYLWHTIYATFVGDAAHLYFQDPPIWEQLTPNQYVVIYGLEAVGSVGELPATLSFSGDFTFCSAAEPDSYPECEVAEIVCRSNDHKLTITH